MNATTLEAAICKLLEDPRWAWAATWFRLGEIIVQTPDRTWATRNPDNPCPRDVTALGCRGITALGHLAWVGFDLDVVHGRQAYLDTETALADARRIRDALEGRAEIRLSKSGQGVHVRSLIPAPLAVYHRGGLTPEYPEGQPVPASEGPRLAKTLARKLGLKADPSSLGRQSHWLWTSAPVPDAFKLIAPHLGVPNE